MDINKTNIDIKISDELDKNNFSISDTVSEMDQLMYDAKNHTGAEALKVRLDLIKHAQSIHGSKVGKSNINIGFFTHQSAGDKLTY